MRRSSTRGCSQIPRQAHPTRLLACASLQLDHPPLEHGTRLLSQILSAPTCQSYQSRVESIDRPLPLPSQISVFETRGSTQPNVAAQAFFSRSLLCHATIILIRSFLFYQLPSRFRAPVLAQMTDGPPRSTSYCASALSCRPLVISCLLPYFSIRHLRCLLRKTRSVFPCLPTFSVLFFHTASLIHRHLVLYHSQVAIFEFDGFESSPTSKIRPGICTSILSLL
ncbi:hypothetical protein V8E52_005395 [Russula decolorans]